MPKNPNLAALRALRAQEINRYGHNARLLHLAYGLIRGLPLDRIESAHSNPHLFPRWQTLVNTTLTYYRPIDEGQTQADYDTEKEAFRAKLKDDILAWKRQLQMTWLDTEARRRAKKVAVRLHNASRGV